MRATAPLFLLLAALVPGCARHDPPGLTDDEPAASVVVAAASSPGDVVPARTTAAARPAGSAAPSPAGSVAPSESELPIGPEYEVDAEHGVELVAITRPVWIHDMPDSMSRRLGYLTPGMVVRRAERPVSTKRCKNGWFRVAPRGFLCQNGDVTTDRQNPVAAMYLHQARRGEPLPYVYGRVQSSLAYRYAKAPTRSEQRQTEGDDLDEHVGKVSRAYQQTITGEPEPLPPLLATGGILPKAGNVTHRARHGAHRGAASGHSSFAFFSVHDVQGRLFGLSTDLDLVPLDRLKLAAVTKIHGGPVDDLPAGVIVRGMPPKLTPDASGKLAADGTFDTYDTLSLTGQSRDDLLETRDGTWVPAKSVLLFKKRTSWPGFLREDDTMKWVDVNLTDQTLVAYEGHRAVFATRVSTGAGGDDPETGHGTIKGMYRIQAKHVTATMAGDRAEGSDYELADVPYVQYFHHDFALHAAFWHEKFGTPVSHGCVNLTPRDAAWIFEWTEPHLPPEWHGMEANGEGTLVFVH